MFHFVKPFLCGRVGYRGKSYIYYNVRERVVDRKDLSGRALRSLRHVMILLWFASEGEILGKQILFTYTLALAGCR
jgi:hypothetical protein